MTAHSVSRSRTLIAMALEMMIESVSKIVEDLETFPNLGQGVVRSLGLQIQETLYATAPGRLVAAEALTRLLDSRPENNFVYGTACLQDLFAPIAARDYYRASTERYEVKGEVTFTCDPGDPGDPRGSSETFTASAQVDDIPRKKRAAK